MKLKIALLLTALTIGLHGYLTIHFYDLNYGVAATESVCNINAQLNCDAVAASAYSSFLGAPLALWGAITNAVLFLLLAGWMLGWTNDIPRIGRYSLWLAGGIAAASVVMGVISFTAMSTFCIFCIGAYVLSFANLYCIYASQEEGARPTGEYLRELATSGRAFLMFLIAIPLLTLFINRSMVTKEGPRALTRVVNDSLNKWRQAKEVQFSSAPLMVKGSTEPKMTIVEFADFRCGHCKQATVPLNAFLSSRPDVQVKFYSFPLDASCNADAMGENGISCLLAKAVGCAEQTAQKGWKLHDQIFAHQEDFITSGSLDSAKTKLAAITDELQVTSEPFKACIESPETHDRIKKMAKEGAEAGLRGTPTFWVNGRILEGGQVLKILEAAYTEATGPTRTR